MRVQRQRGMTLIETMVAMTISSVLILGSIQMYAQARSSYRTAESVARMQENLRFSIDILNEDIRLAGFWGKTNANGDLRRRNAVAVTCNGVDVTSWILDTGTPGRLAAISALQQASDLPFDADCPATAPRENSDVLIVRHAAADQNVDPNDGDLQIQSNGSLGAFFDNGVPPEDALLNGEIFDVVFNAYYVSNESKYDSTLPSLRRLSLVGNRIEDQEIIPGVENLQIQFGIIRAPDTELSMYVDGDDVMAADTIVSARLWLLVRSEQNEAGQGYVDIKGPYQIPGSAVEIGPTIDADQYPPTFRRTALSQTIVLRNLVN